MAQSPSHALPGGHSRDHGSGEVTKSMRGSPLETPPMNFPICPARVGQKMLYRAYRVSLRPTPTSTIAERASCHNRPHPHRRHRLAGSASRTWAHLLPRICVGVCRHRTLRHLGVRHSWGMYARPFTLHPLGRSAQPAAQGCFSHPSHGPLGEPSASASPPRRSPSSLSQRIAPGLEPGGNGLLESTQVGSRRIASHRPPHRGRRNMERP